MKSSLHSLVQTIGDFTCIGIAKNTRNLSRLTAFLPFRGLSNRLLTLALITVILGKCRRVIFGGNLGIGCIGGLGTIYPEQRRRFRLLRKYMWKCRFGFRWLLS